MTTRLAPWLSLIGIGEDGRDGLSHEALTRLAQARLVVGGRRHLALAAPFGGEAETLAWPSPLADALPAILARRGEPVCVLASGDPFFHGIGTLLVAAVPPGEIDCRPAPSSLSLAAARLGWSLQDCRWLSLHGRDLRLVIPQLQPRARLLLLTWDEHTPMALAALLVARGFGGSRLHVMQALGGPRERIATARAESFVLDELDPLNVVALEVEAGAEARVIPLVPGLPDEWFEHDGQITKAAVRAATLAALRPFRGAHLWDIGSGSGSVAIEWMLRDPAMRATAIDRRTDRIARIERNAGALGVPGLALATGPAPQALAGLAPPDAIFIGGGAGDPELVDAAWAALPAGGRLVINAVTLETASALAGLQIARGGELTTLAVTHAVPVGRYRGWRPAMPVTQWAASKP